MDFRLKITITNSILFILVMGMVIGCDPGSPGPFSSQGKWRVFDSKPESPPPAAQPGRPARAPEPKPEISRRRAPVTKNNDPQALATEKQVNDQVERMKHALEQSPQNDPVISRRPSARAGDSDSLAAKLAAAPEPTPAPPQARPVTPLRTAKGSRGETISGSRPMITPIKRTAPVKGKEPVATPSNSKPQAIRITDIEPVRASDSSPTPIAEPVEIKNAPVSVSAVPANTGAKVEVSDPDNTNASLEVLLYRLEQKIKDRPEDTATQVKLRLVYAMLGQWQQALKEKAGKDTTGGEFGKNLAALVKAFDNSDLTAGQQANQALKIVEQMQDLLRRQADLSICNLQICREVSSFGCFKVMPASYFVTGRSLPVIIYIELENFMSKFLTEKQSYQTLLSMTIEVLAGSGKVCWRQHYEQIEDLANKQRRDFYLAPQVTLPAGLPEGKLRMKVMIEDLNGNKVAQRMLNLEVRGK
jgi:hypothetical protein